MINGFVISTALDYDMDVEIVEDIYEKYPDTFYEELEKEIIRRANSGY